MLISLEDDEHLEKMFDTIEVGYLMFLRAGMILDSKVSVTVGIPESTSPFRFGPVLARNL